MPATNVNQRKIGRSSAAGLGSDYDAIVIGAGLGGLTAAALLARAGRSVAVLESHDRVGGYAHAFRRRGYRFDSAVHLIGGCESDGPHGPGIVHQVLEAAGIGDRCEFVRIDPFYSAYYPDLHLEIPTGVEPFIEAHAAVFPAERDGIRRLVRFCLDIRDETLRISAAPLASRERLLGSPTLMRYHRATAKDVLDDCIGDEKLKTLLATTWPYLGLPPSKVSFLYWASMLMTYVAEGAFYCRDTFQTFAEALSEAVTVRGGAVALSSRVQSILVEGGTTVRGVELEDGRRISAPVVISNADARHTIEDLLPSGALPSRYVKASERRQRSVSAFVVYAATDLDVSAMDVEHENFIFPSWSHEDAYASVESGQPDWLSMTVPTLADSGLAPDGEHVVTLTTLMPFGAASSWHDAKDEVVERMLTQAEAVIPGLRDNLRFVEGGSPSTMVRYTGNTEGAIYGWELSPGQVGPGRPGSATPLGGLYVAGHWAQPGGGVYGVVTSGVDAASAVLGTPAVDLLARASN